jgi:hypothetical protein
MRSTRFMSYRFLQSRNGAFSPASIDLVEFIKAAAKRGAAALEMPSAMMPV